jgi:hypothetical protein
VFSSATGLCAAFGTTPVHEIAKKRIRLDSRAQTESLFQPPFPLSFLHFKAQTVKFVLTS